MLTKKLVYPYMAILFNFRDQGVKGKSADNSSDFISDYKPSPLPLRKVTERPQFSSKIGKPEFYCTMHA